MSIGFLEALSLILITLKLTGFIDWDWVVLFLPVILSVIREIVVAILTVYNKSRQL